ncbi:unnamed protein product, partial [Phaeothamnion confervicola]
RRTRRRAAAVAAGGAHSLVLVDGAVGEVLAFGEGSYGQLGDGHLWNRAEPRVVVALDKCVQVAAGDRHSVAVRSEFGKREAMVWGWNRWGECGCGDRNVRLTAEPVLAFGATVARPTADAAAAAAAVVSVAAGARHTIFLVEGSSPAEVIKAVEAAAAAAAIEAATAVAAAVLPAAADQAPADPSQPIRRPAPAEKAGSWCFNMLGPRATAMAKMAAKRGGHEVVYNCSPCGLANICLGCARYCHGSHAATPRLQRRNVARGCDC